MHVINVCLICYTFLLYLFTFVSLIFHLPFGALNMHYIEVAAHRKITSAGKCSETRITIWRGHSRLQHVLPRFDQRSECNFIIRFVVYSRVSRNLPVTPVTTPRTIRRISDCSCVHFFSAASSWRIILWHHRRRPYTCRCVREIGGAETVHFIGYDVTRAKLSQAKCPLPWDLCDPPVFG